MTLFEVIYDINGVHVSTEFWFQEMVADAMRGGQNAARLLEDEIDRCGLQLAYSNALVGIIGYDGTVPMAWAVLRATPEQRARAFVEATKDR